MIDYRQIEAIHQQVREFVEQQELNCKVTRIDGHTVTQYMATLESQHEIFAPYAEFILTEVQLQFHVEARYLAGGKRLSCEVYVTSDGKLFLTDQVIAR